jgi:hypothetical protein
MRRRLERASCAYFPPRGCLHASVNVHVLGSHLVDVVAAGRTVLIDSLTVDMDDRSKRSKRAAVFPNDG